MRRWRYVAFIALLLVKATPASADWFAAIPGYYWPGDGVLLEYDSDDSWDFQDVYVEGSDGYWNWSDWPWDDFWDPIAHNAYWDEPTFYSYAEYYSYDYESWWDDTEWTWSTAVWNCYDSRSDLNQEYVDWGLWYSFGFLPGCGGVTAGPGWGPFPFSALNSGDYPWGVIRNDYLYDRAAQVQYNAGYRLVATSGYRNPYHNWAVGGEWASRHQWGDAVDVVPYWQGGGCMDYNDWLWIHDAAQNADAGYIETYQQSCSHVHADWRNW